MKKILRLIYKYLSKNLFTNKVEITLSKINKTLKDSENSNHIDKTLKLSKQYFKDYSKNPSYLFNHAITLQNYEKDPNDGFKLFENYENIKSDWLKENLLSNLNQDFIPYQQIAGCLGNHNPLFYYLIYKKLFLKKNNKSNVLLNKKSEFTNPTLVNYFKKDLEVIKSDYLYEKLNFLYELRKVPLEFTMPFQGVHYPWFAAINFIKQEIDKLDTNNQDKLFFNLNHKDEARGKEIMREMGVPEKKWFVTLHVREGVGNKLFNSSPKTYLRAVRTIHENGGVVIRVGDKSMTKLNNVEGLIDYPFTKYKSDFMDVYLAAKNEFCIATSSGYWSIPTFFRKPVLLTNYLPHFDYFMIDEKSIFLPKKLFDKKNKKILSFESIFSFPLGYMCTNYQLNKNNIQDLDNTEEEINNSVIEMLVLQKKIKNQKVEENLLNKNILYKKKLSNLILNNYKIKLAPSGFLSTSIPQ